MKKRPGQNEGQATIFDLIICREKISSTRVGSLDIDRDLREAVSQAIKQCPLSRYQIAARMSELVDRDVTKTMLDAWTAESKELHRFPAIFLPAFCSAVGDVGPLTVLAKNLNVYILPGAEALRSEIRRIDEDITKKRQEKKRREALLSQIEEQEPSI